MKNYYEILEVNTNASYEVIEKAYRTLAKKYHPDTWPSHQSYWAEDRFKEITEAYQILSNSELRKEYDIKIGIHNSFEDKYNNLYNEHEKLKREVNNIKIKNESNEYIDRTRTDNNKNNVQSYFKRYTSTISSLIHDEIKKSPEERSRDLKALILTIIIISILVFIFWKVPFLNNLIFP